MLPTVTPSAERGNMILLFAKLLIQSCIGSACDQTERSGGSFSDSKSCLMSRSLLCVLVVAVFLKLLLV